jgi:hypothetical protein
MTKWQKQFLSRGQETVVYFVEQLNTDPEFVGSQPAAASARRKLQKVNSRIPATVVHLVQQSINDPEFDGSNPATAVTRKKFKKASKK